MWRRVLFLLLVLLGCAAAPLAQACNIAFNANKTGSTNYSLSTSEMNACDPVQAGAFNDNVGDFGNTTMSPSGSLLQMDSFSDPSHIKFTYNGNGSATAGVPETGTFWAYDSGGSTIISHTITITINGAPISVSPSSLTAGTAGSAYSQQLSATGGTSPYTYSVIAGVVPPGMSLSASGLLSGTPTASGTFNFTARATDTNSNTGNQAYALVINAATISYAPSSPAGGTVGAAYSQSLTGASGGNAPYSHAVASGSLPAGLSLASNGTLSGTPTAGGTFNFTVRATDSTTGNGPYNHVSGALSLVIAAPTIAIAPVSLTAATVSSAYSATVSASGGTSGYSFAVTAGSLPAGMSLNSSTGALTGTPTAGGSFNFTVTATDSSTGTGPYTGSRAYSLTVNVPTLTISPVSGGSFSGTVGAAYSRTFSISGGSSPYSYSLSVDAGSMPAGLSFSTSTGVLSGTPTAAGSVIFTVTGTDSSTGSGPYSVSGTYDLTVAAPTISVAPASLPNPALGSAYSQTVSASGGTAAYGYVISAGSLPAGLSLNGSTGVISGTPTAAGSFNFTVQATDAGSFTGSRAYSVTVSAPTIAVAPVSVSAATVGTAYTTTISASGGTSTYSYAITAGALPAGLSLNGSTGVLSGTPSAAGSFNFTVTATDSSTGTGSPFSGSRAYALTVNAPTVSITPVSLGGGSVGASYAATITASGGTGSYGYAITAGALPAGLSLNGSTGALSGTPTVAGSFNFTVTATDSSTGTGSPFTGSRAYTLTVAAPMLTISPTSGSNLSGSALVAYSQTFAVSAGTAPYSYGLVVNSGSMPAGLSFSTSTGVLSGTPTAAGTVNFTVTGTDSSSGTGSPFSIAGTYALTIGAPTVTVAPASLPNPAIGTAYSQTASASGGSTPYAYVISAGALPAGLGLNAGTGVISGTATAVGVANFTVQATDANSFVGTRAYSVTIAAPTIAVAPGSVGNGQVGTAYNQTVTASGGTSPYTFTVTAGALPAGVTLNPSTGVLSGTPTTNNTYNFTVTATDSSTGTGAPFSGSNAYSVVVSTQPPVAGARNASTAGNTALTIDLAPAITGGVPASIAVASGPAHGTTSISGLTVTYTPATGFSGTDTFTYTATNLGGTSAAATVTISVASLLPAPVAKDVDVAVVAGSSSNAVPLNITGTVASVLIASPAGHGTAVVNGTAIVYTPVAGYTGTDSFTYTASNAGGTSNVAVVNVKVTAVVPAPVASNVVVSVVAGSSNNPVPLNITGAVASVALVSPAAHGTATVNGTAIVYTPVAGYLGTDIFSYTASNAGGTSASAVITITVVAPVPVPVVKNVDVSVVAESSNNVVPLGITGDVASVAIAAPAAHGTATVNGTGIVYTPVAGYVGTDSFAYTASNAGGSSAPAVVSVTVTPRIALPVAGDVSLTVAANSKANPLVLSLSGGAAASVAVATAPAHGTVAVSGTTISYTPAADYFGSDSFTYNASNASGTSVPATVSVTVSPPPPVVHPVQSNVSLNSTDNLIPLVIDGGPAVSIIIVTPPQHGKVTVLGLGSPGKAGASLQGAATTVPSLQYTPDVGYIGPDSFTYTASNAAGVSAAATVSLQVTLPPPVLGKVSGVVQAGKSITLDVGAQATGGPFTGLVIVTAPLVGTATVQGNSIVYASPAAYSGQVSIVYALSNAFGATQGTATITVDGRADPSKDAEVTGLLAAQAESARRFADAQVNNFTRRMESLHRDGWSDSSFGLTVASTVSGPLRAPSDTRQAKAAAGTTARGTKQLANQAEAGAAAEGSQREGDAPAPAVTPERRELGFWIGGGIDFGQRNATASQEGFRFHTDGVSLGADYRVSPLLSLGVGAGFGRDVSDVGDNGSKSKATNNVLALYGTLRPADKLYIDGLLGYSLLDYDLNRYQTGTSNYASGSRKGRQAFGALVGGYDFRGDGWLVSPYGRVDLMSTSLDGYTESAVVDALRFDEQTIRSTSGAAGVRVQTQYDLGAGKLEPRLRIEYRHHFEGADNADIRYADLGTAGVLYTANPAQAQRNQWLVEVGGKLHIRSNLSLSLDYSGGLNNSSGYSHAIRAAMEMWF